MRLLSFWCLICLLIELKQSPSAMPSFFSYMFDSYRISCGISLSQIVLHQREGICDSPAVLAEPSCYLFGKIRLPGGIICKCLFFAATNHAVS